MPRVTYTEVAGILPSNELTQSQIQASIDAANQLVDKIAIGYGLSDACLKSTELYASAHFCSLSDITLSITSETEPFLNSSASYGFNSGEGINGTRFGQMANALSGGLLSQLNDKTSEIVTLGSI